MRIAVSSRGPGPEHHVDNCFGRAYWFVIFDTEAKTWEVLDNSVNRLVPEKVGVLAARFLAERRIEILLTGEAGPKAFRALQAGGIMIYHGVYGTVQEVVHAWEDGAFQSAGSANGSGNPTCLIGGTATVVRESTPSFITIPVKIF